MATNYFTLYSGDTIRANQITAALHKIGIEAIVKNEGESGRLAGFAAASSTIVDIQVHESEKEKALAVLDNL